MGTLEPSTTWRRGLWGSWRAECEVLAHSSVLGISGAVLLLLTALVFYSSAQAPGAEPAAGFHVGQALILLGLFGSVVPAVCGAYLGGAEWDWRTRPWRQVTDGRWVLWAARVLVVAALAVAAVLAATGLGIVFDLINGYAGYTVAELASRMLFLLGVMLFWGLVGFLLSTLLRSFAWGAVLPIVVILLEPLADSYLASEFARVLPVWNIKIVLHALFPGRDGALAVILPAPGDTLGSALSFVAYLTAAVGLGCAAAVRRDR